MQIRKNEAKNGKKTRIKTRIKNTQNMLLDKMYLTSIVYRIVQADKDGSTHPLSTDYKLE